MSDLITVTGVVLSAMPIGEYDKRVVLLTRERGKIFAFARGARRANSPLLAASNPFVFGTFSLYEGRSSYSIHQAAVKHHFTELAAKQPGVYYGFYFLELADFFSREYTEEEQTINLLYVTLRALLHERMDNRLIRSIYELKILTIQGEYPQMFSCCSCGTGKGLTAFDPGANGMLCATCAGQAAVTESMDATTLYTIQYIITSPPEKLYTFTVTDYVCDRLAAFVSRQLEKRLDRSLKSLSILESMEESEQTVFHNTDKRS